MGVVANEPSMEDILSSIKRIIADGSDRAPPGRNAKRRPTVVSDVMADIAQDPVSAIDAADEEPTVLELTETVDDEAGDYGRILAAAPQSAVPQSTVAAKAESPAVIEPPQTAAAESGDMMSPPDSGILSDRSALAARQSLSHLSALLVRPNEGESNTLEGLVREMLKPMLKQWLDERLPELVEAMVKKEIDRITGRLG